LNVLRILGRTSDAVSVAKASYVEDPDSAVARQAMGIALAASGNDELAQPILEETWQQSRGRVGGGSQIWPSSALALIAMRQASGDKDNIDELAAAISDDEQRKREAGYDKWSLYVNLDYVDIVADYLTGERQNGLNLLATAVQDGAFILPNEAYLQMLHEDPNFAAIRARQKERQASERRKFLSVVCSDNPYEDVWQPAEGTCERFMAEGS